MTNFPIQQVFLPYFIQSRPINLNQRASPAAFTAMTRCVTAHQTPRPLSRCCDAQTKVLSADMETAPGTARQKPLRQLEEKMVRSDLFILQMCYRVVIRKRQHLGPEGQSDK